ncbi:MAG: hypothetical protein IKQ77_05975 [Prevotella sp.]|nr:hypothetical protein [Prevotella sp.]
MKKLFLTLFLTVIMTAVLQAQQISVVSGANTNVYQTLKEAIENAPAGSVIYLPGGGFQISDDVKITKKLTIVGVSHRADTDNADGATTIAGHLQFIGESSGSAVMGVYVSGNIYVGDADGGVDNVTIKYCNVNSIQVNNGESNDLYVNQCYLREQSSIAGNVKMENNIMNCIGGGNGAVINNNIIFWRTHDGFSIHHCTNSSITNNFILNWWNGVYEVNNCFVSNNCIGTGSWGENPIILDGVSFDDIFESNNGIAISSDYSLKENVDRSKFLGTDGKVIGIEGGTGFSNKGLAPIPYIVDKRVDEKTDASGMLNVKIRVKAGE